VLVISGGVRSDRDSRGGGASTMNNQTQRRGDLFSSGASV